MREWLIAALLSAPFWAGVYVGVFVAPGLGLAVALLGYVVLVVLLVLQDERRKR